MSHEAELVLDASALLAYLQDEPGADLVEAALGARAAISSANWAEVLSKLAEVGQKPEAVGERLTEAGLLGTALLIVPLDEPAAVEIGRLRPLTRSSGLGLGDRACLALGLELGVPVITTDRVWSTLELQGITVQLAR
jgi:ribonuclease VapC